MKTTPLLLLTLVTILASGCIVEDDGYNGHSSGYVDSTSTTTTTTVIDVESGAIVPAFVPVISSVSAAPIMEDLTWDTSWNYYTMTFGDVADTLTCDEDMALTSPGSVVTLRLSGYEVDNELAACPTGTYRVAPDCNLAEGEACLEIQWRDTDGFDAGNSYATDGFVDIYLETSFGGPNVCVISTETDGGPDLNFEFTNYFDAYELSPYDDAASVCTTTSPDQY